ncbi:protein-disulfide reductase DsbD family protein [Thermodesulfobacteriota bacterium]
MRLKICAIIAALFSLGLAPIPQLTVVTESNQVSYQAGNTAILALDISIPEGFHLYANPMGPGVGLPFTVTPDTAQGITWQTATADPAHKYTTSEFPDQWNWVWEESSHIFVKGLIAAQQTESIHGTIALSGLICQTTCVPVNAEVPYTINIAKSGQAGSLFAGKKILARKHAAAVDFPLGGAVDGDSESAPIVVEPVKPQWNYQVKETQNQLSFSLALFFAFVAGIILNFMPCVLPVLGIKIMAFSEGQNCSKARIIAHSLVFAGGMIFVFLVLATLAAFAGMSWGEQFQNPIFIVVLISIMFVFGLGLFDFFLIINPPGISKIGNSVTPKGFWGDFFNGVFATVLATPCSGPLLGATLAWSVTQSKLTVYLIFLTLGLGMAFPYVLLASSKRMSAFVPKPGIWMINLKHTMAYLLFGFAVYLMVGLPTFWVIPTVGLLVIIAAAISLYGKIVPLGASWRRVGVGLTVVMAMLAAGWHVNFNILLAMTSTEHAANMEQVGEVQWHPFAAKDLQAAHARGQNVIIDFTANWCMNCQLNKVRVYYSREVEQLIKEKNIYAIKADLTTNNMEAEALLKSLGSNSIPFFAIFPGDNWQQAIIMRDIVSKKAVLKELEKLQ